MNIGTITVRATVRVDAGIVSDILSTAFESGSDWIKKYESVKPTGEYLYAEDDLAWENRPIKILTIDDESHMLTRAKVLRGIEKYCNDENLTIDALHEQHDAGMADAILQLALFGEEVYS